MNTLTSRLCRRALYGTRGSAVVLRPYSRWAVHDLLPATSAARLKHNGKGSGCGQPARFLSLGKDAVSETALEVEDKKSALEVEDTTPKRISLDDLPGAQSGGDKYVMVYTCKVCDHRSGQKISKKGYHEGAVLVRCPSCENLHLIADHLGIFEEKGWNIEDFMKERGENFNTIKNDDIMEFIKK
jgi:hypothetical protein